MNHRLNRRSFLGQSFAAAVGAGLTMGPLSRLELLGRTAFAQEAKPLPFKISLAQWSLHSSFFGKKLDPLDFAKITKTEFGIEAVEYVNQFFADKAKDEKYLGELKKRADDHGVASLLIMIDREGDLGDPDDAKRKEAVEKHHKWVDAAKFLGCHSIRVNARRKGSYEEQLKLAADGLAQLTEYGAKNKINVIVENHGGLSSNGEWLASVIKQVDNPHCGTLPDFGNFHSYDRYKGVKELMPFAKGVSAKSHDFDEQGNETHTDYAKMMKLVLEFNYHGYVGIEYEGKKLSEFDGIKATKKLLEKVGAELA